MLTYYSDLLDKKILNKYFSSVIMYWLKNSSALGKRQKLWLLLVIMTLKQFLGSKGDLVSLESITVKLGKIGASSFFCFFMHSWSELLIYMRVGVIITNM